MTGGRVGATVPQETQTRLISRVEREVKGQLAVHPQSLPFARGVGVRLADQHDVTPGVQERPRRVDRLRLRAARSLELKFRASAVMIQTEVVAVSDRVGDDPRRRAVRGVRGDLDPERERERTGGQVPERQDVAGRREIADRRIAQVVRVVEGEQDAAGGVFPVNHGTGRGHAGDVRSLPLPLALLIIVLDAVNVHVERRAVSRVIRGVFVDSIGRGLLEHPFGGGPASRGHVDLVLRVVGHGAAGIRRSRRRGGFPAPGHGGPVRDVVRVRGEIRASDAQGRGERVNMCGVSRGSHVVESPRARVVLPSFSRHNVYPFM